MIVLVVNFKIKEGQKAAFLEVMNPLMAGSQSEPGCIEYNLFGDTEDANALVLIEKFQDQAALDFHNEAEHFKQYAPKLGDFCDSVSVGRFSPVE